MFNSFVQIDPYISNVDHKMMRYQILVKFGNELEFHFTFDSVSIFVWGLRNLKVTEDNEMIF